MHKCRHLGQQLAEGDVAEVLHVVGQRLGNLFGEPGEEDASASQSLPGSNCRLQERLGTNPTAVVLERRGLALGPGEPWTDRPAPFNSTGSGSLRSRHNRTLGLPESGDRYCIALPGGLISDCPLLGPMGRDIPLNEGGGNKRPIGGRAYNSTTCERQFCFRRNRQPGPSGP